MKSSVFDEQNYGVAQRKTLRHMALWSAAVCLFLAVAGRSAAIPGFLFGALLSLVYFLLLAYRVRRSADLPPAQAVAHMRSGWAMRLVFIVMMLAVSTRISWIEFWPAVVGLFSLQCVIFFHAVYLVLNDRK